MPFDQFDFIHRCIATLDTSCSAPLSKTTSTPNLTIGARESLAIGGPKISAQSELGSVARPRDNSFLQKSFMAWRAAHWNRSRRERVVVVRLRYVGSCWTLRHSGSRRRLRDRAPRRVVQPRKPNPSRRRAQSDGSTTGWNALRRIRSTFSNRLCCRNAL